MTKQAAFTCPSRSRKDLVSQLRAESRRATKFEQRAQRSEMAERSLNLELQRARARIADLETERESLRMAPESPTSDKVEKQDARSRILLKAAQGGS